MAYPTRQDVMELLGGRSGVEQLFRALPQWAAAIDRDMRVHMLSSPLGDGRVEVPEQHLDALSFIVEDRREAFREIVEESFRSGEPAVLEYDAISVTGSPMRLLSSFTPIRDEHGDVSILLTISNDLTESRSQQERLAFALEREREAAEQLRELESLKAEFVANVVHDLRTPITVIQGFADTLEQRWEIFGDEERRAFLRHMSVGTHRLMRLVDDVLLASRLDAGELPLHTATFDLAELARIVASELSHGQRGSVRVEAPEHAPIRADELRIRQVLVNLVANALRYAPEGDPVVIGIEPQDDAWMAEVVDHGPGLAPTDQSKLFQRFSQLDPESAGHGGSGLGLFICRSIVEAHGGEIGVDSELGQGARFWFTIAASSDG